MLLILLSCDIFTNFVTLYAQFGLLEEMNEVRME